MKSCSARSESGYGTCRRRRSNGPTARGPHFTEFPHLDTVAYRWPCLAVGSSQKTLGPSFVLASSLDILPLSTPHCIGNKYSFFFSQVNTVLLYDIPWHVINSCLCHCRVYFESSAKAGTWLGLAWFELEARHMKSHLERGRNA